MLYRLDGSQDGQRRLREARLDVGGAAQDVEPLQDHADGAQLTIHPLQSTLQRHLVEEARRLTHSRLSLVALELKL